MYNQIENDADNEQLDIRGLVYRYLAYWPWIALSIAIAVIGAVMYLRYTPDSYTTTAKVKVLTEKEATDLALDLDKILGKGNVNLENERAVFQSFRINRQVVAELNLQVSYFQMGRVNETQVFNAPFKVVYVPAAATGEMDLRFEIKLLPRGYSLTNLITEETVVVPTFYFKTPTAAFPFTITPRDPSAIIPGDNPIYTVSISSESEATQGLRKALKIMPDGKDSDILLLSLDANDKIQAQAILNTLIAVYIEDGILDRQEVSKRTITFIDERFKYLTTELDSIEAAKGSYKQNNNLSIFEADAASVIEKRSVKNEQLFQVETQLLLADVLAKSMTSTDNFNLLPANIGLNSGAVNTLVSDYNTAVLEYNKWKASAGDSNPKVMVLKQTILDLNRNITSSLTGYKDQLEQSLEQNKRAQNLAQESFMTLPNKEKILRSIERQQLLKENLYLLLLQKREEAAITMATTAANVKVIDYAITNSLPVAPKRKIILLGALLLGVFVPVGILYLKFLTNTKIYTSRDVEAINPNSPILGEIPVITNAKHGVYETAGNSQTEEAFRTLAHNINFMQVQYPQKGGRVIAFTSSVKGEGKTTVAFNVAHTYFQSKKRVLLVGADLRNPQLHPFIDETKNTSGLSNYLSDTTSDWKDFVLSVTPDSNRFNVLLSGPIPPMPAVLLSSPRFKDFLDEARTYYDYIIIDTAPTLLVADTLTFVKLVDLTAYVVRSGITEKPLIEYSKKLVDQKKIDNIGYIINDIDHKGSYGYGYNYGYGYGYSSESVKKPWYQFWGS
ncbi:polysaccharide biosynthesis tyrosine autokinase [Bizionia gelidisalsuginis]|uniref:non-specific protein-tyrosine kinase n=2 Tax=Bizionia TaxID=283785 RepID=A0A8H2LC21_9FLAO|nr:MULTISPECIES: tyrosine-protein kinase family protein [Bizionia]TYB69472.1 polysaccharide biosynthesis tyrosine autokinase [Bizionia saleffrena]TYC08818.1 polysaccharide biosynthesis tyrosine autokinase [Bizionia gelidisalsuginis]